MVSTLDLFPSVICVTVNNIHQSRLENVFIKIPRVTVSLIETLFPDITATIFQENSSAQPSKSTLLNDFKIPKEPGLASKTLKLKNFAT